MNSPAEEIILVGFLTERRSGGIAHDGFVTRRRGRRCTGREDLRVCMQVCVWVLSACLLGKCKNIAER